MKNIVETANVSHSMILYYIELILLIIPENFVNHFFLLTRLQTWLTWAILVSDWSKLEKSLH
jgi:hypothetical protein